MEADCVVQHGNLIALYFPLGEMKRWVVTWKGGEPLEGSHNGGYRSVQPDLIMTLLVAAKHCETCIHHERTIALKAEGQDRSRSV